jgi:branched-chain amino acid transport system ATP-binding protein
VLENVVIGRVAARLANFVEQIVGVGRARREQADAQRRADEIIDFLDLGGIRDRWAGTLPYGLQKRVELARALVARPKILLLDEPMAGMTPTEKQEMTRFVRAARDELGTTVILIEHDIGIVMGISDQVAVLDHGRKITDGTPTEVQANQGVIDAYLGAGHDDGWRKFMPDLDFSFFAEVLVVGLLAGVMASSISHRVRWSCWPR